MAHSIEQYVADGHTRSNKTEDLLIVLLNLLLFLVFLLVLLGLNNGGGNSVQVTETVLAYSAATVLSLLKYTNLLQRLANFALHRGGRFVVVGGTVSTPVASTVQFCEGTNTDVLAEVDVSCNRS